MLKHPKKLGILLLKRYKHLTEFSKHEENTMAIANNFSILSVKSR